MDSYIDVQNLKSPKWRLNHLYYITNKDKKKVKFKLNSVQKHLEENEEKFNCTLKARQLGISTYWLIKYLDLAIFNKNQTVAILSHDRDSLRKLFKIIRYAHKNMHPEIRPALDKGGGSQYRLYFPEINSEIYCTLEAVSDAVSHLHISEMALNNNPEKIETSMDAVPIHTGRISIETTPRGFNHFHDFWKKQNKYRKFFFPWYMNEEYALETHPINKTDDEIKLCEKAKSLFSINITDEQIAFRRVKISERKSIERFLQEYPEDDISCFIASGTPAFDLIKIQGLIKNMPSPIRSDDHIRIYKEPDKTVRYVCGVDTAEGINGDYSVAVMMDVSDRSVVAVLRGHFKPYDFAHEIYELCKHYRKSQAVWPLLGVERNNHGHAVLLELKEHIKYTNLYYAKDERPGWVTDRVTRPVMLDTFIDAVENNNATINDMIILNECLTLINNNGKIEAAEGKHDDTIIATSIAIQLCLSFKVLDIYNDIEKKLLLG